MKCSFCNESFKSTDLHKVPFKANEHSNETMLRLCVECNKQFVLSTMNIAVPETENKKTKKKAKKKTKKKTKDDSDDLTNKDPVYEENWTPEEQKKYETEAKKRKKLQRKTIDKISGKMSDKLKKNKKDCEHLSADYNAAMHGMKCRNCKKKVKYKPAARGSCYVIDDD